MILGQNTFIMVVNEHGKSSQLPVQFVYDLIRLGRTLYNTRGEVLTVEFLGERDLVEIETSGPIPRAVKKKDVHLVVGPDTVIQGTRALDIRGRGQTKGYPGDFLKTAREGDARVIAVRGHSSRSQFRTYAYEVNATSEVHGVLIDA